MTLFECPDCGVESNVGTPAGEGRYRALNCPACRAYFHVRRNGSRRWVSDRMRLRVTFVDLRTRLAATHEHSFALFWWTSGNGSCDCNRVAPFDTDLVGFLNKEERERADREEEQGFGQCYGHERFVAVHVEGDIEPGQVDAAIEKMNEDYPETWREALAEYRRTRV